MAKQWRIAFVIERFLENSNQRDAQAIFQQEREDLQSRGYLIRSQQLNMDRMDAYDD